EYYALANEGKDYLLYNSSSNFIDLDLSKASGSFSLKVTNARNGVVLKEERIKGGGPIKINKVSANDEVIFIHKN
ncbi:MAG: hypothetical protein ACQUHE_17995, partial [Bacteroidia bacterium]